MAGHGVLLPENLVDPKYDRAGCVHYLKTRLSLNMTGQGVLLPENPVEPKYDRAGCVIT